MTRVECTVTLFNNSAHDTSLIESSTDNTAGTTLFEEYEEVGKKLDYIKYARVIVPIVLGLITVIGIVGNTLTVAVVSLNKEIRSITNILIMSLAVADILFIVLCVPFKSIQFAMFEWPFGDVWCRISMYFTYVCPYASMYMLVLISLDRYIALVHPIRALSLRTKRNCYIVLAVIWSIILLGNMHMLFKNAGIYYIHEIPYCINVNHMEQSSIQMFYICFFVFGYMLPIMLLCVLYVRILKVFLTKNIPGMSNHTRHVRLQSEKRVTNMVIIVVVVFTVCWLPFHIFSLCIVFTNYNQNLMYWSLYVEAACMSYMNSCINPILYAFYSKTFRKGFRDILSCRKRNYF